MARQWRCCRLFLPTADTRLIALNADTGKVCEDFGDHGSVDLRHNIGSFAPGGYYSTSPPAVTKDLVVIGGHVTDNISTDEPSGVIRAYDVRTGKLVWNWDSGNPDDTTPIAEGQTYTRNSPNMWSMFAVDENLGMLYLPMGNQMPDQYGGDRTEDSERYSAGVTALDITTGKVRWYRQFTHHDLWDMDVGVVSAESVHGINVVRDFFTGVRDFFGGRSQTLERALKEARAVRCASRSRGCRQSSRWSVSAVAHGR